MRAPCNAGGEKAHAIVRDHARCMAMAVQTGTPAPTKAYGAVYAAKQARAKTGAPVSREETEKRQMIREACRPGGYALDLCKAGGMTTVFDCSLNQLYGSREPLMSQLTPEALSAEVKGSAYSAVQAASMLNDIAGFGNVTAEGVAAVRLSFYEMGVPARQKHLLHLMWDGVREQASEVPDEYMVVVFGYPPRAVKQLRSYARSHSLASSLARENQMGTDAPAAAGKKRQRRDNETPIEVLEVIEECLLLYCKDVPDPQGKTAEKRFISTEVKTKAKLYYKCMQTLQDRGILAAGELVPRTTFFRRLHEAADDSTGVPTTFCNCTSDHNCCPACVKGACAAAPTFVRARARAAGRACSPRAAWVRLQCALRCAMPRRADTCADPAARVCWPRSKQRHGPAGQRGEPFARRREEVRVQ